MEIKIELLKLGKTQKQLRDALEKRGITATPCQISLAIRGGYTPKEEVIRNESMKIISEWQQEENKK